MDSCSSLAIRTKQGWHRGLLAVAATSAIGGILAAFGLLWLHPHPTEALPASPVFLLCLLRGGGDAGAIIFIWVGGFILYGIYGAAICFSRKGAWRLATIGAFLVLHLTSAWLCELSRMGKL